MTITAGLLAIPLPADAQQSRLLITVIGRDHGRVESPLSGATVRVKRREDGGLVATGTTDGSGIAEIIVPPLPMGYTVSATLHGYEPDIGVDVAEIDVWAVPGDVALRFPLRIIPPLPGPEMGGPPLVLPDKGRIFGRVVLPDGTPLPQTSVQARGQRWGGSSTTAGDGSFRFELFPDTYTIHAAGRIYDGSPVGSRNGDYPSPVVVESRRTTGPVDVVLEPLYLFNVTVIVTNDVGDRIPGAHIEVSGHGWQGTMPIGADGARTLKQIPSNKTLTIIANASLGGSEFAGTASVHVLDADQQVSVVLQPAARLSGRVEFGGRLTPLHGNSGLYVTAHPPDAKGIPHRVESRRALVNTDGGFTLSGLVGELCLSIVGIPPPWYVVDVTQHGFDITNKVLTFNPGEVAADVAIRLERAEGPIPERPQCKP